MGVRTNGLTDEGKKLIDFFINTEDPKNKLGKYGKSFIYTKRSINKKDEPVSVGTLIETIVSNIKDILKNGSNLNENLIFK